MDYILEHSKEIMYLCFGGGFLVLMLFLVRTVVIATRIIKKIDDLTDIFIEYIQKPLGYILQAQKIFSGLLKWFNKK